MNPPLHDLSLLSRWGAHCKGWWPVGLAGLALLMGLFTNSFPGSGSTAPPPQLCILAAWDSNGEQFVTFRPDPTNAIITYAEAVSAAAATEVQPPTVRSFGQLFPVRRATDINYSLHYVALPVRTLQVPGRAPLAYSPGSYTVAYTPTESGCRVRVGVAAERRGLEDFTGRLRVCWEQKSLAPMRRKSYLDPVFVLLAGPTNAPRTTAPER